MTINVSTSNNAAESNKGWTIFIYAKDMPVDCEGVSREGENVKCKILSGEKVQFKVKKVSELSSKKGSLEFKFVCAIRNFFSATEPLSHAGAFYRAMAITSLSPASGRYAIKYLRVDGNVINRKDGGLFEYLYTFLEDALNYCVYKDDVEFDGKSLLIKLPGIFQGCHSAVPVSEVVKPEFPGSKLFDVSVDGSSKKYALKRIKGGKAAIGTDSSIVSFNLGDLSKLLDAQGFHTDRGSVEVVALTQDNLENFKKSYC